MRCLVYLALFCMSLYIVDSASTANPQQETTQPDNPTTKKTTPKVTTVPTAPTTTLTPKQQCQNASVDCKSCVGIGSVQCVWCESTKKCMLKEHLIPTSECPLKDAKWAVCWVNYEAVIIASGVIGGLLILALTVCICCCCCCKKNNSAKYAKEDAKVERKKAEMKEKHSDRRAERKAKNDEIRRKYGLIKDDNPYTRFGEEN